MKKFIFESFPSQDLIKSEIDLLKKDVPKYKNIEVLTTLLNLIDLTSLNTSDTVERIKNMTEKVNDFNKHFPNYKNVAAICIYPIFVQLVKENIKQNNIKIAAVGASFPSSQTFLSVKAAECELIVHKGANEVDIVISVGAFLENNYNRISEE
ncbi:MAG: deoxyribose-phosphate aldolase, partial [Bacteroidales bacterium]|nr:deoxyribose-phosphate aldolase [Bacteroidales bacterium]